MSIEIIVEGQLDKEEQREEFSAFLLDLCERNKMKLEDYDAYLEMDICPEGIITCSYEGIYISINAQTNVAGPGFHTFVCTFFDKILQESDLSFEVLDPTGYYEDRDFESLKYEYFYRWLNDIKTYVLEQEEQIDMCLCWPLDAYMPQSKEGYIVTPIGYLSIDDLANMDIEQLANRFFIWNGLSFDAMYYRNCALTLLWKECYFSYSTMNEQSDKIANMIIDYMEAAYDMDSFIALPLQSYQLLCDSIQRTPQILDGHDMGEHEIGYRKSCVSYTLGNWCFSVDGCSEKTLDKNMQTLHLMAPYRAADEPWRWLISANAYSSTTSAPSFDAIFNIVEGETSDYFELQNETMEMKGIVQKIEDHYRMVVQAIDDVDTITLEYTIHNEQDIPLLKEWAKQTNHKLSVDSTNNIKH